MRRQVAIFASLSAYRDCKQHSDSEIERLLAETISRMNSDGEQAAHEALTGLTNALERSERADSYGFAGDEISITADALAQVLRALRVFDILPPSPER